MNNPDESACFVCGLPSHVAIESIVLCPSHLQQARAWAGLQARRGKPTSVVLWALEQRTARRGMSLRLTKSERLALERLAEQRRLSLNATVARLIVEADERGDNTHE